MHVLSYVIGHLISKYPHPLSFQSPTKSCITPLNLSDLLYLINTLENLIKKIIGDRLQFHLISNNFIYLSQLGCLKQRSMLDTSTALMYFICLEWVKQKIMSTLAFDIAQFFPSLNH